MPFSRCEGSLWSLFSFVLNRRWRTVWNFPFWVMTSSWTFSFSMKKETLCGMEEHRPKVAGNSSNNCFTLNLIFTPWYYQRIVKWKLTTWVKVINNHVWNGLYNVAYNVILKTLVTFRYIFPHFSLCWAELLELKVRIPCETLDYVMANYGKTWNVPVRSWDWKTSPSNVQENGMWPPAEWDELIQVYWEETSHKWNKNKEKVNKTKHWLSYNLLGGGNKLKTRFSRWLFY